MLIKIIEFLPVIAFFAAYKITSDLILATAIVVGSCLLATAVEWFIKRELSRMQIFLCAAILLFGLPTVLLKDPSIIKWKVTVVNLILALTIFVFSQLLKKNPFAWLFGKELPLPDGAWAKMANAWMVFFVFAAGLNVVIAFYLPDLFGISEQEAEDLWVDYKTFGNGILNFVFAIVAALMILRKYPGALEGLKQDQEQK